MSVWHTPQATSRTSTSPARGAASSTSCTTSGAPNSSRTAARIFMARDPIGALRRTGPLRGVGALRRVRLRPWRRRVGGRRDRRRGGRRGGGLRRRLRRLLLDLLGLLRGGLGRRRPTATRGGRLALRGRAGGRGARTGAGTDRPCRLRDRRTRRRRLRLG